jgi:UDP-N-acetylmuramoyl-L-alanyl-D-glutamate--2,6-diaminopimelate ligase
MPALTPLATLLDVAGPQARLVAGHAADVGVSDVTHDSRDAAPGVLFACRPGQRTDGHDHAPQAVAAGSPALLVERALDLEVPQLQVPSVATAMGPVAAAVHGHPSAEMHLYGVTGTNGKTTSVYLLEAILAAAGHVTGVVGTVETRIAGEVVTGVRTTPESTDLQRLLRRMRDAGVTAAAMEVSSHGLALGRVHATRFAVALFTNLTQDHLDFHAGMEDYYAAKRSLFTREYTDLGVVNIDDAYGQRLADDADVPVVRVSPTGAPADVGATAIEATAGGSMFTARLRTGEVRVHLGLPGLFNVANALLSLAAAEALGVDPGAAAEGLARCAGVPGRMERVDAGQPFTVLVDYAHTPDSLTNVLQSVRTVSDRRVIVVVGCGGDRDAGKRPAMGRIAAELADLAVLTSDNPRSEDPQAILDAVVAGASQVPGGRWSAEIDRRQAIAQAFAAARPGDVVVIAGKGHEATQELADRTIAFDDRLVARELLAGAA